MLPVQAMRSFATNLRAQLVDLPILPFTGLIESLYPTGLCWTFAPRRRRSNENKWFTKTTFMKAQQYAEDYEREMTIGLIIHWPTFLENGMHSRSTDLRPHVHHLLRCIVDLVEQFDYVLSEDIRCFYKLWVAAGKPATTGAPTDRDQERFDRHLKALIENPRFMYYFMATIRDTFDSWTWPAKYNELTHCQSHGVKESCELCNQRTWLKTSSSVIFTHKLQKRSAQASLRLHKPDVFREILDPWKREIRYLLSCNHPLDGGVVVKPPSRNRPDSVLAYWGRIAGIAARIDRESILRNFIPSEGTTDWLSVGNSIRLAFDEETKCKYNAERYASIYDLVASAYSATLPDRLEIGFELYTVNGLVGGLEKYMERADRVLRIRNTVVAPEKRTHFKRRVASYEYIDSTGVPHTIRVIRRKRSRRSGILDEGASNWFTTPYDVPEALFDEEAIRNMRFRWSGITYWSVRGINRHSNLKQVAYAQFRRDGKPVKTTRYYASENPMIPEAKEFLQWAVIKDSTLSDKSFVKQLFEQRYNDRLVAKESGDREHLGFFTQEEDSRIRVFFEYRAPGPLTPEEEQQLEESVPQRGIRAILRRRDILALEHALRVGYDGYVKSGYFDRHSAKRRRRWLRRGVKA